MTAQIDLVRRTLCAGASDDELALFLATAKRLGLDPVARQIHAVKRWDSRAGREVMTVQVGIDGLRTVAHRTGEMDGYDAPQWCGADGVWRDVWLAPEPPAAARCTVYRRGHSHGYTAVAVWSEYAVRGRDGSLIGLWGKMPALMLSKCAEALALRRAFPAELAGIYEPAEMDQADSAPANALPVAVPQALSPAEQGMTNEQKRQISALCTQLGLSREARAMLASGAVGRAVHSATELSQEDAQRVIAALEDALARRGQEQPAS